MSAARAVGGLLVLGAAGAVAVVVAPQPLPVPDPGPPCSAIVELDRALDLTSLRDQAVVRARATELAAALEQRSTDGDQRRRDEAVAQQLVTLLEDPGATTQDLLEVVSPVAQECGVTLRSLSS